MRILRQVDEEPEIEEVTVMPQQTMLDAEVTTIEAAPKFNLGNYED